MVPKGPSDLIESAGTTQGKGTPVAAATHIRAIRMKGSLRLSRHAARQELRANPRLSVDTTGAESYLPVVNGNDN